MAKVTHAWLVLLASLMERAMLLMGADDAGALGDRPQELPVGVLTAVLSGGGYLLWLMHRRTGPGRAL